MLARALARGPTGLYRRTSQLLGPGAVLPWLGAYRPTRAYRRDWYKDVSEGRYGGPNFLFRKLLLAIWKRTGGLPGFGDVKIRLESQQAYGGLWSQQAYGEVFTPPRLVVEGYRGPVQVVVSLVTPGEGRAHPHRLMGGGSRSGVCVVQGGEDDRMEKYALNLYRRHDFELRKGQHRPKAEYRRIERDITKGFFWIIFDFITTINKKCVVTIPDLKIKYTGEKEVVRYLEERERIPKSYSKRPPWDTRPSCWPTLGDPFGQGFQHKTKQQDLSCVMLCYEVTLTKQTVFSLAYGLDAHRQGNRKWVTSEVIYDTSPRILAMSTREAAVEGGNKVIIKVNRDDVAVEFFDQYWSETVEVPGVGGDGVEGPYTAELEVEVPQYRSLAIGARHEVAVRLVGGEERGPSVPFYYNPRGMSMAEKERVVKEQEDKLLGDMEKVNYLYRAGRQGRVSEAPAPAMSMDTQGKLTTEEKREFARGLFKLKD